MKHLARIMQHSAFERPLACLGKASRGNNFPVAAAFTHNHDQLSCGLSAFRGEAHQGNIAQDLKQLSALGTIDKRPTKSSSHTVSSFDRRQLQDLPLGNPPVRYNPRVLGKPCGALKYLL